MSLEFKTIDEAVKEYVKTRDHLRAASAAFNKLEEDLKGQLVEISMWLRDKGDELGVDNFRTQYGTAFRGVKTSYRVSNWEKYIEWIKSTGNFQCLERRAAKLAVKEIHDESGEIPPGLDYSAEVEFLVRRPTKS